MVEVDIKAVNLILALKAEAGGHFVDAVSHCQAALNDAVQHPELYPQIGVILLRLKRWEDARLVLERAAAFFPDDADAAFHLANVYFELSDLATAKAWFLRALAARSEFPDCLNNLGLLESRLGNFEEAEVNFLKALALRSDFAEALSNLGDLLRKAGRLAEAEQACRHAIAAKPELLSASINLSNALREQGRFEEALAVCRGTSAFSASDPIQLNNIGAILSDLGRLDEAIPLLKRAVDNSHDYPDAEVNLALSLLKVGRYQEGWRTYHARWKHHKNAGDVARFSKPLWLGQPIGQKTLLVHAEQGMGDTIQFCRYVIPLARGHRVVLEVQSPLQSFLQNLPFVANVYSAGAPLPAHDIHCPLLDLPSIFGTQIDTIPSYQSYLPQPNELLKRFWLDQLKDLTGLKVGLVWSGNQMMGADGRRSIPLQSFAALSGIARVSFVSIQVGDKSHDEPPAGLHLHRLDEDLSSFSDTAALVSNLDLIISVDTASVHLAAGLGRPTWLLNRYDSCWRWLLDRVDSPWYPTLKQFRQPRPGDWDSVFQDVRFALAAFSTQHACRPDST